MKFTEYREIFDRKSQINVWRYTKSLYRNPLFNTPFVFNKISIQIPGNVCRFQILQAKFTDYREIFKRKFRNSKTVDGNLLSNTSFVFNENMLRNVYKFKTYKYFLAKLTECREIFDRKSQINVQRYTKSVDRNPFFNTPFVFNEIGLKMLGNVSRFHICECFISKFTEYREIFKRKFQNIKTVDGNLLLNT